MVEIDKNWTCVLHLKLWLQLASFHVSSTPSNLLSSKLSFASITFSKWPHRNPDWHWKWQVGSSLSKSSMSFWLGVADSCHDWCKKKKSKKSKCSKWSNRKKGQKLASLASEIIRANSSNLLFCKHYLQSYYLFINIAPDFTYLSSETLKIEKYIWKTNILHMLCLNNCCNFDFWRSYCSL